MAHVDTHTNGDELVIREEERDPSAMPTFLYGLAGIIVLLALIFFAEGLYYRGQQRDDVAKIEQRDVPGYGALKTQQLGRLGGYEFVDPERRIVSMPIDKAIERTVADLKAGRPLPTITPAVPPPAPTPDAPAPGAPTPDAQTPAAPPTERDPSDGVSTDGRPAAGRPTEGGA